MIGSVHPVNNNCINVFDAYFLSVGYGAINSKEVLKIADLQKYVSELLAL